MGKLDGKVAVITGGSSGMALAGAKAIAGQLMNANRWSQVLWHCVELDETVGVDHYKDASASRASPPGPPAPQHRPPQRMKPIAV
jgi:NAD(P)-dependent dehydrogenase (short-subunit alcohol dehydrogenase family)